MPNVKVIFEIWPSPDFKTKVDGEDINSTTLYGINGEDGLVINTDYDNLAGGLTGSTRRLLKTRSGASSRVNGVADPVAEVMSQLDAEGIKYKLYADKPCELIDGVYNYLVDANDWGPSNLPSIHAFIVDEEWFIKTRVTQSGDTRITKAGNTRIRH